MLRRRNIDGKIAFEDITQPAFDPGQYGLTMKRLVGSMHAIRADGNRS